MLVYQAFGQQDYLVDVRHYGVSEGLSEKHVYQTFQDSRGMYWFVTARGLDVFDGTYFYNAVKWPAYIDFWNVSIRTEDTEGRLWIRLLYKNETTFIVVDSKTREKIDIAPLISEAALQDLWDITLNSSGKRCFLNKKGELWAEQASGRITFLKGGFEAHDFVETRFYDELIWLWDSKAEIEENTFTAVSPSGTIALRQREFTNNFEPFRVFNGGGILGLANNQLKIYTDSDKRIRELNMPAAFSGFLGSNQAEFVAVNPEAGFPKQLVFLSEGKVSMLWLDGGQVVRYYTVNPEKFTKPGILDLFVDRTGLIWIVGLNGVTRLDIRENKFKRINWSDPGLGLTMFNNSTRGITMDSAGNIYVVSSPDIRKFAPGANQPESLIPCNAISPVFRDRTGTSLWMNCGALLKYSTITGTFERVQWSDERHEVYIWSFFEEGDNLWLGSDRGISIFDKKTLHARPFTKYNQFPELSNTEIYHFKQINTTEVWLLTSMGLYVLHLKEGIKQRYGSSQRGVFNLPTDNFRHVYAAGNGIFWFATRDGLLWWDKKAGKSRLWTTQDGLSNEDLYAVYPDSLGNIWLNSGYGIMQFQPETGTCRTFLEKDGIAYHEGNRISHYQSEDGTIFFGSLNGVTVFHPRVFYTGTPRSKASGLTVMSASVLSGRSFLEKDLLTLYYSTGRFRLAPSDSYLTVHIALADQLPGVEVEYQFRLAGMHKNWIRGKQSQIRLYGLPYGKHTLEIKARTLDGSLEGYIQIPVWRKRPFYLQWWFICLAVIVVGTGVTMAIQYRFTRMHKKRLELEAEVLRRTEHILQDKAIIESQAQQLKWQNEEKNRFFSNVTHEFRTPIALIQGPIRVLSQIARFSLREKKLLQIALNSSARLLSMVEDILILSRLDFKQVRPHPVLFSLSTLCTRLSEDFQYLAEEKGVELRIENTLPDGTGIILDERFLRIILNNLLSNALKFTPKEGKITVEVFLEQAQIEIRVSDTGRGIDPVDLPHIFKRFFQTNREDAPAEGGSGIGLALVSELCSLMQGTVTVESQLGRGSTFSLHFPYTANNMLPAKVEPGELYKDTSSLNKPNQSLMQRYRKSDELILIVEDNPDMQQFLEYLLDDYYQLAFAGNGREALSMLDNGLKPALILSDFMMPEMDGIQLLHEMHKHNHRISFLMLTAYAGFEDKSNALRLGIDDYLIKPFQESILLHTVHTLVKRAVARVQMIEKAVPEDVTSKKSERAWLLKLEKETNALIANETFSVDELSLVMLMGRTTFYQEVKRLTGLTPNQYILEARLVKARHLLETEPELTIKEIIYAVGLRDERHFGKVFKLRFGHLPSYYR